MPGDSEERIVRLEHQIKAVSSANFALAGLVVRLMPLIQDDDTKAAMSMQFEKLLAALDAFNKASE